MSNYGSGNNKMTNKSTAPPAAPGWRFRLGILLFVLGFISPLGIPLVTAMNLSKAWTAILSGLLMLGLPELLWLAAAAIMGKPGFNYLKGKVFSSLKKYAFPETVSRTRYRLGLAMFLVPLLYGWLDPYLSPHIPVMAQQRMVLALAGDVLWLASLFVLGGDFWDKLRALFVYESGAPLQFRPGGG
jgi:hypothetical protein